MAAHNNYYGYGSSLNQYSTATGVYNVTGAYTQAVSPQVYNVSQQQTSQYGPYGNRIQSYDEQSSSYYSQPTPSAVPAATSLNSSSYSTATQSDSYGSLGAISSYTSGEKCQTAAKSTYYQSSVAGGDSVSTPVYQTQNTKQSYSTTLGSYGTSSYKKSYAKPSDWSSVATSGSDRKISQWHHTAPSGSGFKYESAATSFTPAENTEASSTSASTIQLSGLDKALFTIATNYAQSHHRVSNGLNQRATWWNKKGKMPIDPSQYIFCELCKMNCPGPQAYKLHIDGKTHKKKEAASATSGSAPTGPQAPMAHSKGRASYCTLCDVACSSQDAYAAHIRGAKHQKVVKVMQRMGQTVPEESLSVSAVKAATVSDVNAKSATVIKKVICAPRINFIGGTQLKSTGTQLEEVAVDSMKTAKSFIGPVQNESSSRPCAAGDDGDFIDGDVQPVGLEYLEEGMNDAGTAPSFYCKLCECHFTDVMAKLMHTKGRRHRLQYKKKVDPTLRVEMKTQFDKRFNFHRQYHGKSIPENLTWRKREMEATYKMEAEELRYEKEYLEWKLQEASGARYLTPPVISGWVSSYSDSNSLEYESSYFEELEQCIQLKHQAIYPKVQELALVQTTVAACEKALKIVSDTFVTDNGSDAQCERQLKGVMRVGLLSKGLLLQEHTQLHLVVLCAKMPTLTLVEKITQQLPDHLEALMDQKYEVTSQNGDISVSLMTNSQQLLSCTISLTSPSVKDEPSHESSEQVSDPIDVLDKAKCLELLAELRHAKWFQARVAPQASCLVVIRLLMDLCRRNASWAPLSQWALELLVEKAVTSAGAGVKVTASDALIRVLQCISSGVLLEGGEGLRDICEKEEIDASDCLTKESREEITRSAQHMLRQIVFGMAHHVLNIEPLSTQPNAAGNGASLRKRPRMT